VSTSAYARNARSLVSPEAISIGGGSQPLALCVQSLICARDEVFENIVWLELCKPDGDGRLPGRCQVGVHAREPPGCLCHGHVSHRAQKLITAEANDQVIGAQMGSDRVGRRAKELVAGGVAQRVVSPLEVVDVDEGQREWLTRPLGSGQLAL
jgi:hypothetical protein